MVELSQHAVPALVAHPREMLGRSYDVEEDKRHQGPVGGDRDLFAGDEGAHLSDQAVLIAVPGDVVLSREDAERRAWERCQSLLETYEAPPIDEALDEELKDFVARRKSELPDAWY